MNVKETMEQLRELQRVDSRIRAIEEELVTLPKGLTAAREDEAAVQKKLDEAKSARDVVLKKRISLESDVKACDATVFKYENEKLKVKTNEEFRAINNQIAHEKEKKSALEDHVLLSYDDEAEAQERVKKLTGEVAMVVLRVAERAKDVEARSEGDRREVAELKVSRERIAPSIEAPILKRYEALRNAKAGLAVVLILRGACGGCFTQIPPQQAAEVRKRDRIQSCESCGRYLVWDEVEAAAS